MHMSVRRRTFSQPQFADTLLEHTHMDKMDKMAVGKWRPKHAIALPAHVLTIIDKVDQHVRTKPSVTTELSRHHRAWHQLYAKEKVCYDTALGFGFDGVYAKEVWVCFHKFDAMGTMQLCTLCNGCLHCVVVRQWVSRSSISVFLYLTLPNAM